MPVPVVCPTCGASLRVKEETLGRTLKCPRCATPFRTAPPQRAPASGPSGPSGWQPPASGSWQPPLSASPQPPPPLPPVHLNPPPSASGRHSGLLIGVGVGAAIALLAALVGIIAVRAPSANDGAVAPLAVAKEAPVTQPQASAAFLPQQLPVSPQQQPSPPGGTTDNATSTKRHSTRRSRSSTTGRSKRSAKADPQASAEPSDAEAVYDRLLKSAVFILNLDEKASGSGSLIDGSNRLVLTNEHVVGRSAEVLVMFPSLRKGQLVASKAEIVKLARRRDNNIGFIRGRVLTRDLHRDLALVQLEGLPAGVQPLTLAAASAHPAQRVHSIGNPGASDALWVYTSGTVRQVYEKTWRDNGGGHRKAFIVETQSPINPGDSGGPLVNDHGHLLAVASASTTDAQLVSLFIDVREVRGFLKDYAKSSGMQPVILEAGGR